MILPNKRSYYLRSGREASPFSLEKSNGLPASCSFHCEWLYVLYKTDRILKNYTQTCGSKLNYIFLKFKDVLTLKGTFRHCHLVRGKQLLL